MWEILFIYIHCWKESQETFSSPLFELSEFEYFFLLFFLGSTKSFRRNRGDD